MTDSAKTLIAALLDRSGLMEMSKEATVDGWRELIKEQAANPGRCQVTLAQFDTQYEVLYPPTEIAAVPDFVVEARGMTALLDAAGKFITEVGQQLSALPEDQRPGQVICLIMTDGMENSSHEWDWQDVERLITQQREVYNANASAYRMTTGLITKGRAAGRFTNEGFTGPEREAAMGE